MKRYAAQLLTSFVRPSGSGLQPSAFKLQPLAEPLSVREREILVLVARGASNQAIAEALVIAPSTVKVHLHHILGKLEARSRTEAVARARELGLL